MEAIDDAIDSRGRWRGIKNMKKQYAPTPYTLKDKNGKSCPPEQHADLIADYLGTEHRGQKFGPPPQWKGPGEEYHDRTNVIPGRENDEYDISPITIDELNETLANLKPRKATGPDRLQGELYKVCSEENRQALLDLLNHWWATETTPPELTEATQKTNTQQ